MAGDKVVMAPGSMIMIHRAWGIAVGNTHDFADSAALFQTFDSAMADVYAGRTGLEADELMSMLDGPSKASDGTWMSADEAIDKNFADEKASFAQKGGAKAELPSHVLAMRKIEKALASAGLPRRTRSQLLNDIRGTRDAATDATRDAGDKQAHADFSALKDALNGTIKSLRKG